MERKKDWLVRLQVFLAMLLSVVSGFASSDTERLKHLERSFSLHASLAPLPENGNWNTNFASLEPPAEVQIHNAARLLTQDYNANRLYLLYQKEIPLVDAERVFQTWREACPSEIEIVPALVLNGGTTNQSELFSPLEIRRLSEFFKQQVNPKHIAVLCSSQMGSHELALKILSTNFVTGLVRLDLQPDETVQAPFGGAIVQTGSALCSAESNEKWQQDSSGLQAVRKWIEARNGQSTPVAWSLAVVGCDYSKSQGEAVFGHNDAERNAAIASGRNGIVISEVLRHAKPGSFTGFNTDLHAMQLSSQAVSHDGSGYSFYEMLKRGQLYVGYYARPFLEIVNTYGSLRSGKTATNGH